MAQINYNARDFDAIRESLIEYARQNFPDWTDLNESDQGQILVELFAYIGDVLHRYIDRQTDELDIRYVTQRENAAGMFKLIGYKMEGAKAATVSVTISIDGGGIAAADVPIPSRFKLYTKDVRSPIVYEILQEGAKISVGSNSVTVTATHGETISDYHSFDGSEDQTVKLERMPVLEGSVSMVIGSDEWTVQPDLLDSGSTDRHFTMDLKENESAVLSFGDGASGSKPNGTGEIIYRIGGGVAGMVGPNSLTVPESPQLLDINGTPISIVVTNATSSLGGEEKQSLDDARIRGPVESKANARTIARPDYENHSMEVAGVARALVRFQTDDATIPFNIARIQIIPIGGGDPPAALIDAVEDYLYNVKPVRNTLVVDPVAPKYKTVDVTAEIVMKPGREADKPAAITATQAAIQAYLADYEARILGSDGLATDEYVLEWGGTVYPDDLGIKVDGVRSIRILEPADPIVCQVDEIPAAGVIGVS